MITFAEIADELDRNGFEAEPFGPRTLAVKAAPVGLEGVELERMLEEVLAIPDRNQQTENSEARRRRIAATHRLPRRHQDQPAPRPGEDRLAPRRPRQNRAPHRLPPRPPHRPPLLPQRHRQGLPANLRQIEQFSRWGIGRRRRSIDFGLAPCAHTRRLSRGHLYGTAPLPPFVACHRPPPARYLRYPMYRRAADSHANPVAPQLPQNTGSSSLQPRLDRCRAYHSPSRKATP